MLMWLTIPFMLVFSIFTAYLLVFLIDPLTKRFKKTKETKVVIIVSIVSLLGCIILPIADSHIEKNLKYETTNIPISSTDCYIKDDLGTLGTDNLLLYTNSSGEIMYVWVDYVETDSLPYLEIKQYKMSKLEKILICTDETNYTLYANPEYVHIISDTNDIPIEML